MRFAGLMPKLVRSIGLVGLCVVSAMAAEPIALSADDKLAAIRQGLLEAALEGPTQVQATQWIDAKGALRESSSYRNGMQVRGVRVLGYTQDATGKPNATLQWQSDDQALLPSLRRLLTAELERASTSSAVWRLNQMPNRGATRSTYEQALLGGADEEMPWQLRISLQQLPAVTQARTFGTWTERPTPIKIAVTMALGARGLGKALSQVAVTLDLEADASNNWQSVQWTKATSDQISTQAHQWARQLETELSCQPVVAKVTEVVDNRIRINAGASAGLRVGDEWLLADGKQVLERTLEASLAPHTVLAKVMVVAEHHAQLTTVAGANKAVGHNWIGWTTEGSR